MYATDGLFFTIKNKGQYKIMPHEVLFLEADGFSTKFYMVYQKEPYIVSMNLSNVAPYFPTSDFFRLSRSLVINLDHLERIADEKLYLKTNDKALQIPTANKQALMQNLLVIKTK